MPGSLCRWRHEHGRQVWQKCTLRHEPVLFCSSLVKREPAWLCPAEELKYWKRKARLYREQTYMMSAHGNIFTFSTFSWQLASSERKWALYCLISEGPVKQATFKSEIEADYSGATSGMKNLFSLIHGTLFIKNVTAFLLTFSTFYGSCLAVHGDRRNLGFDTRKQDGRTARV